MHQKETSPELRILLEKLVIYCQKHDQQVLTKVEFEPKGFSPAHPGKALVVCIHARSETVDELFDYLCQRLGIKPGEPEEWTAQGEPEEWTAQ